MALIKGQGPTSLTIEVYDALGMDALIDDSDGIPDEEKASRKQESKDKLQLLCDTIIEHVIANLEVKGVEVQVDPGTYIISVSGGSGAPAVGVPNPAPFTHTQSNDGKGLVE